MHIKAALDELVPTLNAFTSEAVQLRLVDGLVLPSLLADEARRHAEAALEYFIGLAGKLAHGDAQKDLEALRLQLDALKAQAAIPQALVERIAGVCVRQWRASNQLQAAVSALELEIARQDERVACSPDQHQQTKNALRKILDIMKLMDVTL